MARSSRQQRRQRRAQAGDGAGAQAQPQPQRSRSRQQVRPAAQPQKQQTGRREPRQRGRFARESAAELRKVEWPGRSQVIQGTIVVIIACAIVGAYLYLADAALSRLVEQLI